MLKKRGFSALGMLEWSSMARMPLILSLFQTSSQGSFFISLRNSQEEPNYVLPQFIASGC
jgi:hypothetical protein